MGFLDGKQKTVLMAVQNTCPKVNDFADYFFSPGVCFGKTKIERNHVWKWIEYPAKQSPG
jgi:hypothetical protein